MNPASFTLTEQTKSLVHWLSLAGIQTETGDELRQWFAEPLSTPPTSVNARTAPTSALAPIEPDVKFNDINELNAYVQQWKRLAIAKTATHTLIGTGVSQPNLMVICDTPDSVEDQKGQAFCGHGNRLILEALRFAGFSSDTLYMTYLSKWRPAGQKVLSLAEIGILSPLLHQEIAFIRPKAILAIGESTLKGLGLDSVRLGASARESIIYTNQQLDYKIPVLASQKGEFLVKTPGMKKNFWLSMIHFATTLRAGGVDLSVPGSPSVNNTE